MPSAKRQKNDPQTLSFDSMVSSLSSTIADLPDKRTGTNCRYSIKDAALGVFSVFFAQSPSFLLFQESMQKNKGISNAQTLFDTDQIPSDNHIRALLDEVEPSKMYPIFYDIFNGIKDSGHLDAFRSYDNNLLCTLDGTHFFSSNKIHCLNCSTKEHKQTSVWKI